MSDKSRKSMSSRRKSPARRQRSKLGDGFAQGRLLRFESLEARRLLSLNPIISEVEPGNSTGIVDTLGNTADWVEVYNPDPTTAVDLSGWSLYYAKTNSSTTHTWTFPNNVILGPGEFRVVFCDSSDTTPTTEDAVGELDTGYSISKAGATLELINKSSAVVSSLTYPTLNSDTSYGPAETVTETDLVAAGATASYYAPTSGSDPNLGSNWNQTSFTPDSAWASGPTGLGFANTVNGFAATVYKSNLSSIASVATADTVISTPADQSWTKSEPSPTSTSSVRTRPTTTSAPAAPRRGRSSQICPSRA